MSKGISPPPSFLNAQLRKETANNLYVFRECDFSLNDTCPLVPCMAGGSAEWLRYFNELAEGGNRGSRMLFAGERGGGRNAPAANSLK